jgi:photosystem II stability/assembly factor-like uncharacterized protein
MKPHSLSFVCSLLLLTLSGACQAQWQAQQSHTHSRLRGVSVVNARVVWASGAGGTVLRTIDGGVNWQPRPVPGADRLDFRDVHAVDERMAFILSIGPGELSRIDKTSDGGATWSSSLRNTDPRIFLDAISFWDETHGIAQGDPVEGRFVVLTTDDGGKSWVRRDSPDIPPALPGEGAFAASGTCLVTEGRSNAWFGTGGAGKSRVFRSTDRGRTWTVAVTPIAAGSTSSGIFSLAYRDADHGVAVGGDYRHPELNNDGVALTRDGGRTWQIPRRSKPGGLRSAVAYVPGAGASTLVAVGPTGTDMSNDDGETWRPLGAMGFHAVGFAAVGAGWAVGEDGRIGCFRGSFEPAR